MKKFEVNLSQGLSTQEGGKAYHGQVTTNLPRLRDLIVKNKIKEMNPPLPEDNSKGLPIWIKWIKKGLLSLPFMKDRYSIVVFTHTRDHFKVHIMEGPQHREMTFLIPKTPETVKQNGDKILIEL